ncbi:MAG TPA: class III extradiol dioxygenase subunit B-like domain-containing protein [Thermoleophilia bacterium]
MSLVGCFVTPHPPIIVPEVGGRELARVEATVEAMRLLGGAAAGLDPDSIVVMSPHAPLARGEMGISVGSDYRGSFAAFRAPLVRLAAPVDRDLAQAIVEKASVEGVPVTLFETRAETVELDHGAMVPLFYATQGLKRPWRLLVLSFSYLDLETHVRFGRALAYAMEESPSRILYIASGDLSHRLIPGAPAGHDPRGAEFDGAIADTFARGDWKGMLSLDGGMVRAAGECGYRSLAVLAGIVQALGASGRTTQNHLLSYEGPFGVGYLVGEVKIGPGKSDSGGGK